MRHKALLNTAVAEETRIPLVFRNGSGREDPVIAGKNPSTNTGPLHRYNSHTFTYVLNGEPLAWVPILQTAPSFHQFTASERGDSRCAQC
jgi:hypothetical protein